MVEERRHLLPGRRDLPRRRPRRHRRLHRVDRSGRTPGRARHRLHLAHAVLPRAEPRRRLRHHRLLLGRPAPGLTRRRRGVPASGTRPRHPGDRRPRREPHLGQASVVQGGPPQPRRPHARLVRLGRRATAVARHRRGVPRCGGQHLDQGRPDRAVVPAPLLLAPTRPQHRQPRGAERDRQDRRVLARGRRGRLPGRRRALPDRDRRHERRGRPGARPARAAA